jgi:hypothetical protein
MQNAFDALANNEDNDDSANTVATQVAASTLQSQLTVSTATNSSQRQDCLYQQMAHQQTLLHANQHQILEQLAALLFNASDGSTPSPLGFPQPTILAAGQATQVNMGFGGRGHCQQCGRNNYARHASAWYSSGSAFLLMHGCAARFTLPPLRLTLVLGISYSLRGIESKLPGPLSQIS